MHRTEHCVKERRAIRCSAPLKPFSAAPGSMPFSSPRPSTSSPLRDPPLVTAFRSPTTAAPLDASIPGSTLPACYFAAAPTGFLARSARRSTPAPGSPRSRPASSRLARCVSRLRAPPACSATSTPLSGSYSRPDRSVQLLLPPFGPPSESARFPLAPRSPLFFKLRATDHRSWSATFPEACCSSNLLEPFQLCPHSPFSSIANRLFSTLFLKIYLPCF
jgi:hypothetical protein